MPELYVSSVTGHTLTKEEAENYAKSENITLQSWLDKAGYTTSGDEVNAHNEHAERTNDSMDEEVTIEEGLDYDPQLIETEDVEIDPKDVMFDFLEPDVDEAEYDKLQLEKNPNYVPRKSGYSRLLQIEEEEGVSALGAMFPGFKFEESTGATDRSMLFDVIKITSPDGKNSTWIEMDITKLHYGRQETVDSLHEREYNKLKDFIKENTNDVDQLMKDRGDVGETMIDIKGDVQVTETRYNMQGEAYEYKTYQEQTVGQMTAADIYKTSHLNGGAAIDQTDIDVLREEFGVDENGDWVDNGLFDIQQRQRSTGSYSSPTSGIVTHSGYQAYDYKPYEFQLNQTRKALQDSGQKFNEEDVKRITALNLYQQEVVKKKNYIFEQFIDSQPESTQGVMIAYNLEREDNDQKEVIKKSLSVENQLRVIEEKTKYANAFGKWYNTPNQTFPGIENMDAEDVVVLDNGKAVPREEYFRFLQFSKDHESSINLAIETQKEAFAAQEKVQDRQAQWDLLRRDYDVWSKSGTNITLGAADIVMGGAYMIHKAAKYGGIFVPGVGWASSAVNWLVGDKIDDAMADYYGWSQEARQEFQRDVAFEDAFKDGNFGEFFMSEMSKQIPIVASIIASGGAAAPWVVGTYSAGQEWMRLEHANKYKGANHSELEMGLRSIGYGTTESVLGTMPTVWILGRGANMMTSKFGKEWAKNAGRQFFMQHAPTSLVYAPLIEAGSEGATAFFQNGISIAADKIMDRPNNLSLWEGVDHSAFVGGMMGLTLGGVPYSYGQAVAGLSSESHLAEVIEKQKTIRGLEQDIAAMDGRTSKAIAKRNQINKLKGEINEIVENDRYNVEDKVGERGMVSYQQATTDQGKIYWEAYEIEQDYKNGKLSRKAKNDKLAKLKVTFDNLQRQRDIFRSNASFGTEFSVYEAADPEGYADLKRRATAELQNENNTVEGDTKKQGELIKKKMEEMYNTDRIDLNNKMSEKVNKKLGRNFEVKNRDEIIDLLDKRLDEINNEKKGLEDQKKIDELNAKAKEIGIARGKIKAGKINGYFDPDGTTTGVKNTKFAIRDNQIANDRVYTGIHELGHEIFEEIAKKDPEFFNDLAAEIQGFLKAHNPGVYNRMFMRGTALINKTSDEIVMEFLEELADNRIDLNAKENRLLAPILGWITNHKADTKIPFKNRLDTVAWLNDLATQIRDGKINKTRLKKFQADARRARKLNRKKKVEVTKKDLSMSESAARSVDELYNARGKEAAWDIIQLYEGMANKLANKYQNVPGFERQLLVDEILTGRRGVLELIQAYNPKSGVPLAAYINKYIGARSIEAANRVLQEQFTLDVTEARGVAADNQTDTSIDSQRERNSKLRRALNVPQSIVEKVKKAVEKTFGTRLPNIKTKDFKKALQKAYRTELKPIIQTMMGTRTKFKNYLEKNWEAIYKAIPQSTINKRFKQFAVPVLDKDGKQKREKTAQGNAIFKKKNITQKEFVDYFLGDNVGRSTKGTRKDALAEALSEELAFDATMEVVQSPEVIQRRKDIAGLFNEEVVSNEIAIIAKEIDRDPSIKFSEVNNPNGPTDLDYVENTFKPQAHALVNLIESLGYYNVYMDEKGFENQFNPDVWKFVDNMFLDGKIDDAGNIKWKKWVASLKGDQYTSLKEIYKERGRLTNKSSKLDKKKYFDEVSELAKALGTDVMSIIDYETLGFVNRLLDPAVAKESDVMKRDPNNPGEYFKPLNDLQNKVKQIETALNFDPKDVRKMNIKVPIKDGGIFKKVQGILNKDISKEEKIKELQKLAPEIEAASEANIEMAIHINTKLAELNRDGKISDLTVIDLLQAQTNIVGGLRGLSRFDYVEILNGVQKADESHPHWKKALAWAKKHPRRRKNGTLIPTDVVARSILNPKGEHVGPWLNTATASADAIFQYKIDGDVVKLEKALKEAYKDHSQFLTTNYNTKAIDAVTIDSKGVMTVSGSTSGKGPARLRNANTSDIYGINGETYNQRTIDVGTKQALKLSITERGNHDGYIKMSESLDIVTRIREIASNPNQPKKGISVLDFDDTLATSKSKVIVYAPAFEPGTSREVSMKLTPAEFAERHADLESMGASFDFSEFNKVVGGKKGPFFNKAKALRDKFGNNDIFILTARPQASAPAIRAFLQGVGLDIRLENITGLENGTPESKASWILERAAEGYNDFLFADDAIKNVKAVKNALDAVDVKSKVYQAGQTNSKGQPNLRFSESNSDTFNTILEDVKGVAANARYSDAVAKLKGAKKGNWTFYLPPSAQDFALMLYNFVGKGKKGNAHWKFFHEKLIKPYNSGVAALDIVKQQIHVDYQKLLKDFKEVKRKLNKTIPDSNFTYQQAARVYLWTKNGMEIPGLSKRDLKLMLDVVNADLELKGFADKLSKLTGLKEGYTQPSDVWVAESVLSDLHSITDKIGRKQFLKEFLKNVDEIFNKDNLNKIEAEYGKAYRNSLEDSIYRMKNGTNRSYGSNQQVNDFMNWINNSVGATMFINIRSATLQMLSFVNFINWSDNNIFAASAAFANFPNYVNHVIKIFNSPKLKQRRSGLRLNVQEAEMAEAANKGGFKGMLAYLLKIGFTPTRAVDSLAISIGGASLLINRTKKYIKQGMSKADAEAKAWEDFSEIAERTQQSADPSLISPIQAGGLGRVLFAWQNTPFQYNRLIKMAGLDLVNRRMTPPYETQLQSDLSNISKILYYGAIQNFIFSALQSGLFALLFDEDDLEDDEKQLEKERNRKLRVVNNMADTILRGSGLPGAIVSTIKNIIMEYNKQEDKGFTADHAYTLIQALNISPTLGSKARLMYSGIKTYKYEKDVIKERGLALDSPIWEIIGAEVQAFTNVPMNRTVQLLRNTTGALDERNALWQRIAMGMGWNYYDFNVEVYPEHQDIKDTAKEERKQAGIEKAKITRAENTRIRKAAEAHILQTMTFGEMDEYYSLSKKDRKAWLKKKVEEYLKKQ